MRTLYEASSAVEAHMIVDLLKQEGIPAQIQGEHLQGAIGQLPAMGLVRVVVEDEYYAEGRDFISRWEKAQPQEIQPRPPARPKYAMYGLLIGLALGIGGSYAVFHIPTSTQGMDSNRDGILDVTWTYAASGTVLKTEVDRNFDGKVDYVGHFDKYGALESSEEDDDFDGVFETKGFYRSGNLELLKTDTDGDGYSDLRSHFVNGVLASVEFVNPATGLAYRVEYFKLGKCTMVDTDSDKDGKLDTRRMCNADGEPGAPTPIPKN